MSERPRPAWVPIYLACKKCQHAWHDWQPNLCPVETWCTHVGTYHCPNCGAGSGHILLRSKPIDQLALDLTGDVHSDPFRHSRGEGNAG